MLVLSRMRDEVLKIGDDVELTVVDIRGDKVRLGISAPKSIPVHRKEVYEAIQRERRAAGGVTLDQIIEQEKRRPGSVIPLGRVNGGHRLETGATVNRGADAPGGTAPASPFPGPNTGG